MEIGNRIGSLPFLTLYRKFSSRQVDSERGKSPNFLWFNGLNYSTKPSKP